ncbi:MAG: RES family NAD+ phosphorylase [Bradyrhizobium sp.]
MTAAGSDDQDALPEPPFDIASRKLPLVHRTAGSRYVRIHRATDDAIWFGWDERTSTFRVAINRFDAPDRSYGVLYVAATPDGAFAESIGRTPRLFRSDDELAALRMTTFELVRDLRVVDLHGGEAVGAIGATGVVGVGPQSLARLWSRALQAHPEKPDGIEYRCRHNSDELALALFHRIGEAALAPVADASLIADPVWLRAMRGRHQIWQPPS